MASDFSFRIGVEGESDFKRAMDGIKQSYKVLSSEMALITSAFDKNDNSVEALTTRNAALDKSVEAQKSKIETLSAALKNASESFGENDVRTQNWQVQLNKAQAQLNQTERTIASNSAAIEALGLAEAEAAQQAAALADEQRRTAQDKSLKSALADIDSQFRALGSQMKAVDAEFKGNAQSAEALAAKGSVLAAQHEASGVKVKALADALGTAKSEYDENSEEVKKLERQLKEAEAEYGATDAALKQNAAAQDEAANSVKDLGEEVSETQNRFEGLGNALKAVGAVIGAAMAAVGAAAVKLGQEVVSSFGELEQNLGGSEAVFGEYAASIQRSGEEAYKNLGVSQSEYLATANKMGALFQGSGIEQQKSLELTEAAMQRAADMASVMGIDMQVALDSISGAAKGNFTMMDNLGVAMNDTTLKAYAASKGIVSLTEAEKAFGDLDIDLNEFGGGAYALDEMKAKYNELVASATNGTGEVRDQAQAALDSVGVSFLDLQQKGPDKLFDKFVDGAEKAAKAAGNVKLELSGAEKAELAMEMFFDKTAQYEGNFAREATQTISGSFGLLQASMDSLVAGLGNADADVGNLTRNVTDALTAVVSNVGPIISNLTSALPTMFSAIADELPTMLPMVLDAIKSLISSLTESMPMFSEVAGQIVGVIVEGLITALPALAQSAIQLLGALGTAIIDNLPLLLEAAIQIVAELAQGLSDALPTLIPTIVKMVADMVQMLIDNAPLLLESALALIEGLVTGLIDSLPILIDALPELIDGIVKFLIEALPMIIDAGVRLFTALIEALPEIIELIVPAIPQIINGITTALVACTSAIIDAGLKLFVALVESLPEIIAEIVKAVPDIIDGIVKSFDSMADDIIDIGSNLLVNIWNGMVAYQGWLQEQITGFFQGIVDTIGSIFGGSAQAIKNETPKTVAAVKERNDAMIAEAKRHQDQEDALRDAANSRHYSRIKEAQNYQNQVDAERDAANAKYYSNEKKAATETANLTKTLAASTAKSRETAAETAEKAAKAAYDAEKLLIEDYRNDVEYSIEGEIAMWEKLGESHKEVSKEKIEIEKSIAKLREDLRKEEEAAAKKLADQQNAYGDALTEALKRRARQETDAKTAELKAQQEAEKQAVNDRIDLIKDAEYREIELDTDTFKGKIKLIDEEHIARIRLTDETLAATLSAYNQEQQAIIDTIALTDQQAAKRLQDIKDQKDAILAESDAAKAAREEASHAEKMADFDHRMAIAATYEEFVKVETEKQKYLDEQAYKADEDARSKRIKELDEETKDILAEAKKRQDALADIAAQNEKAVKKNTDDYADDLKKNGFDDTKAKQDLADLETAYKNFEKVAMESAAKLVAEGEKGQAAAQEILEKYYPEYQNKGKKFVDYLVEGQKANQDKATAKARDIGAATVVGYVGGIDEQLPIVEAAGSSVDGAVADGMIAGINDVLKTVPKIVSSVVGKFDSYYTTIRSIGENIMRGIGAGLTSMSSWLTGLLDGYISDMIAATEARLGIASPSKVFADIGGFTAEGFGKGFVEAMANVRADMLAAIPTRIDAPTVGYDYGSTSTAAPTSIGGGLYQTNNFVFNVPTVTPSEIAKANRRASEALYRAR